MPRRIQDWFLALSFLAPWLPPVWPRRSGLAALVDVTLLRRGGACGRLLARRPLAAWLRGGGPGLDDLLADDVIQSVMQADGVDPTVVRTLVRTVARTRRAAG